MSKTYAPEIEALLGKGTGPVAMGGAYEAASKFSRELALYNPGLRSADSEMGEAKDVSDARSRDVMRNDAYAQNGSNLHKDGIVGSAFVLNHKPATEYLGRLDSRFDEAWEVEHQEEVETMFGLWAEGADNQADMGGKMGLTEMVRLMVGVCAYGGEGLALAEWDRDKKRPFQTAIQFVEVDRLATPLDKAMQPGMVRGVENDAYGKPIRYHIRKAHQSDYMNADQWKFAAWDARKPWGRVQVMHVKEQVRPSQSRAIAEIAAAMGEVRTRRQFSKVLMQNAIVNASYAASIESELPTDMIMASLGAANTATASEAALGWAGDYMTAVAAYAGGANNLHIDGAKLPHLFPGTKLQLRPMGTPGGIGTEFEASLLRYMAAALGVSYEQLSRDYSKTNYSSIRAAMNETYKFMQAKKKIIADRFARHVFMLFYEEALNKGYFTTMPRGIESGPANFYEGLNKQAFTDCQWIGAGRGQIDELKETQAAVLRLKMNLTTLEYEHARFGNDWRKELKQKRREQVILKEYDLLPPEDDMMNAASGGAREKTAADGQGETTDA